MRIYTKQGDTGTTGLYAGPRVPKDDARIEAYGTVDELNAALGVVRTNEVPTDVDRLIHQIQTDLFSVGAELATPDPVAGGTRQIGEPDCRRLERAIDSYEATLEPLRTFILPTGVRMAAEMHVARGICRRAERRVVTLDRSPEVSISRELMAYLNRLGDLLFVLARHFNAAAGQPDVPWQPPGA